MSEFDDPRLQQLLTDWFDALERGEQPRIEDMCRDAPELAPALRSLVERENEIESALENVGRSSSSGDSPRWAEIGPGDSFGDYRVTERLAHGGMARVFVAHRISDGREVALKLVGPDIGDEVQRFTRFRREAEITASLLHDHIVPIYDVGIGDGVAWMAMKRLSGPSLDRLPAPLDPREAARIGAQAARALAAAHAMGVIHRDIKPANLMYDGADIKVLDFGLARSSSDLTLTHIGAVPGTLPYMSPEQLEGESSLLDGRTDVYSLGIALYEAVSGRSPFGGDSPERVLRQIVLRDPPPLGLYRRHRDFEVIIGKALEKERHLRYPTALEFAADLERYSAGLSVKARRSTLFDRAFRIVRRHRRVSLVLLAATVVVLASIGLLLARRSRDAAILGERARRAEAAIDAGRLREARWLAEDLRRHSAPAEIVAGIERRADDRQLLEVLLDQDISAATVIEPIELREIYDRVRSTIDQTTLRYEHRLGLALAAVWLKDKESVEREVRRTIEEFGATEATSAILAAARGEPVPFSGAPDEVSNDRTKAAGEAVFVTVALRAAGGSWHQRNDIIRRAEKIEPEDTRVRLSRALLHWEQDRYDLAAAVLEGIVADGQYSEGIVRLIAAANTHLGRYDEARNWLSRTLDRGAVDVERLALECSSGSIDSARRRLESAVETNPDRIRLRLIEGSFAMNLNDRQRARASFRRILELTSWTPYVVKAELGLAQLDLEALFEPGGDSLVAATDEDEIAALRGLEDRLDRIVGLTSTTLDRSTALTLRYHCRRRLGNAVAAWRDIEEAVSSGRVCHPAASLAYAVDVALRLRRMTTPEMDPEEPLLGSARNYVHRARLEAGRVIDATSPGLLRATDEERLAALECEAILSYLNADLHAARVAVEAALNLLQQVVDAPPARLRQLEGLEDAIERAEAAK